MLGLEDNGYLVDAVERGDDAIDQLKFYEYDVAVIDWRMPGASGIDVVRWARRHDRPTALLMLTARDAPPDRIQGLDAGADDYLVKPFAYDELAARLRELAVGTLEALERHHFPDWRIPHTFAGHAVAADVRARREIEADRAKPRATARYVTLITVGVLLVLGLTGQYIQPYSSPVGQVILVVLLSMYVATLVWMRAMATGKPLPRFIGAAAREVSQT